MSLANETAGLIEVAEAIGRKPEWLCRNWLKLHLRDGFPRKHPSGWTWPRAAVAAWLRGGGASAPQLGRHSPENDNLFVDADAAYRAALDDRYGGRP